MSAQTDCADVISADRIDQILQHAAQARLTLAARLGIGASPARAPQEEARVSIVAAAPVPIPDPEPAVAEVVRLVPRHRAPTRSAPRPPASARFV